MPHPSPTALRRFAWSCQAAYLDFLGLTLLSPKEDLTRALLASAINRDNAFTEVQAAAFLGLIPQLSLSQGAGAQALSLASHLPNTASGFSATLFSYDAAPGEFTFAVRGTEPELLRAGAGVADLFFADFLGVTLAGQAKDQLFDAYRYYKRLVTPKDRAVPYSAEELATLARLRLGKANAALLAGADDPRRDVGLGALPAGAQVHFTGHSLGGHVATLLAQLVERFAVGRVGEVVTFNAPGQGGIRAEMLSWLGIGRADQTVAERVTNIVADGGLDLTAGFAGLPGTTHRVFIEREGALSIANHSIVKLSDALALLEALSVLDPAIGEGSYAALLRTSSAQSLRSLEAALDALRRTFGSAEPTATGDREAFYRNLYALRDSAAYRALAGSAPLRLLTGREAGALAALARDDFGYFLAVRELLPVAIEGAPAALIEAHPSLYAEFAADRAKRAAGANDLAYTDEWLRDRAELLSWVLVRNRDDIAGVVPNPGGVALELVDRRLIAGSLVQERLRVGASTDRPRTIAFGSPLAEALEGSGDADSLYGGDGEDYAIDFRGDGFGGDGEGTIEFLGQGLAGTLTLENADASGRIDPSLWRAEGWGGEGNDDIKNDALEQRLHGEAGRDTRTAPRTSFVGQGCAG